MLATGQHHREVPSASLAWCHHLWYFYQVCKHLVHYLRFCSAVAPLSLRDLVLMCSWNATPACCEPIEGSRCLMIPRKPHALAPSTWWSLFQRDSPGNSEGETLAIMNGCPLNR